MKTFLFTADAAGSPEPIVVQSVCQLVRVRQNDLDASTVGFNTYGSLTDQPVLHVPNENIEFRRPTFYQPGQVIGYLETVTGSIEFSQEEE